MRVSGLVRVCAALLNETPVLRGVRERRPTLGGVVVVVASRNSSSQRRSNPSRESSMVELAPLSLNPQFVAGAGDGACGAVTCVSSPVGETEWREDEEEGEEERGYCSKWEMASVSSSRSSKVMRETSSSGRREE